MAKIEARVETSSQASTGLLRVYWPLLIPIALFLRFVYYRYSSPLRKYPGPIVASGSRIWKVWTTWSGHTEMDHVHLHEKYGSIVRIAPNEVSFSSPYAARDVLAAGKGFHKTDFYWVFPPPGNPDIFTEIRENVHAVKKRYASHPYSMASMQLCNTYIEDVERKLLSILDKMCDTPDRYCRLGDYLHYYAFDVLGEVAFSRDLGFLAAGYDVEGAIKTIDDMQWYDGIIGQIPEWDYLFRRNPLTKYVPGADPSKFLITRMALDEMAKRKKLGNEAGRKDLLDSLLAASAKAPDQFNDGDVFAVAHGAIFAGSDSTASTMQSFFYLVLRDPAIYKKLQNEIEEAAASGALSEMPQWNEVQALPYFQACLKEAMRLRPAVGLNMTRFVPPQGADIDGEHFVGGTRVALNGWVLHRNESVFGPRPDIYRPERWLEGDNKTMERLSFQFGGGSHLCIGKNLALLEMNKTLPLLLREYNLELMDADKPLPYSSTFFVVQKGPNVRISRRRTARQT